MRNINFYLVFLDSLLKHIVGFSTNSNLPVITYIQVLKFINNNVHELNPNYFILINQRVFTHLTAKLNKPKDRFNELLPWVYYIVNILQSCKKEELSPLNMKQRDGLLKKMKDYVFLHIVNPFCENVKLSVQQIIYDQNVTQLFSMNTLNTNFKNLEYLLPTIDRVGIEMFPGLERSILLQYPRCIKVWNGEFVIKNLILLNKFKIHAPEIFELATQNLFSSYIFYFDVQNLIINKEIVDDKSIIEVLKAYSKQQEVAYFKKNLMEIQQEAPKLTIGLPTYIPLGIFLYKVMEDVKIDEMIVSVLLLRISDYFI